MRSMIHVGATLLLKIQHEGGKERVIGFCSDFTFTVAQGQKMIFVVDEVTPAEIAQGASASMVSGSMNLYLPKGVTMESVGLVPQRHNQSGEAVMGLSKPMKFLIYDKQSAALIVALEGCKVGQYTMSITAKGIVRVNLTFNGVAATPGNAL